MLLRPCRDCEITGLPSGEGEIGDPGPPGELGQPGPGQQVGGVATRVLPFGRRYRKTVFESQILPPLVDPAPHPVPLRQQCLVGDLNRRAPGLGIPIERDQPAPGVDVQHPIEHPGFDAERAKLAKRHAAAGVRHAVTDGHQAKEHLLDRSPIRCITVPVETLCPTSDSTPNPPYGGIVVDADPRSRALLVHLGEGVLE